MFLFATATAVYFVDKSHSQVSAKLAFIASPCVPSAASNRKMPLPPNDDVLSVSGYCVPSPPEASIVSARSELFHDTPLIPANEPALLYCICLLSPLGVTESDPAASDKFAPGVISSTAPVVAVERPSRRAVDMVRPDVVTAPDAAAPTCAAVVPCGLLVLLVWLVSVVRLSLICFCSLPSALRTVSAQLS